MDILLLPRHGRYVGCAERDRKSAEFITYLQRQPGVTHAGAHLTMAKATRNTHLTILLRDEPGRYRQAHQLVFDHLYATLRDGNAQVEAQLHPVFERLAISSCSTSIDSPL